MEGRATTYDFAAGADATDDGHWDTTAVGSIPTAPGSSRSAPRIRRAATAR